MWSRHLEISLQCRQTRIRAQTSTSDGRSYTLDRTRAWCSHSAWAEPASPTGGTWLGKLTLHRDLVRRVTGGFRAGISKPLQLERRGKGHGARDSQRGSTEL